MRIRGFEEVKEKFKFHKGVPTHLPIRADVRSAGYDFFSKETVEIKPNEQHAFYTDVKAYMLPNEVLYIFPRSSYGIKKGLMLSNTTGVIDSSYYGNFANDGNIIIVLKNVSHETVTIEKGDRIAQGVFMQYLTTDDDLSISLERRGGIGSSGN